MTDLPHLHVPIPSTETEEFCLVMLHTDQVLLFPSRVARLEDVRAVLDAAGYDVVEKKPPLDVRCEFRPDGSEDNCGVQAAFLSCRCEAKYDGPQYEVHKDIRSHLWTCAAHKCPSATFYGVKKGCGDPCDECERPMADSRFEHEGKTICFGCRSKVIVLRPGEKIAYDTPSPFVMPASNPTSGSYVFLRGGEYWRRATDGREFPVALDSLSEDEVPKK